MRTDIFDAGGIVALVQDMPYDVGRRSLRVDDKASQDLANASVDLISPQYDPADGKDL